jgi:hypothetical protein
MSSSTRNLTKDEGLWGLILGKKYDRLSKAEKNIGNLISELYRGRKSIIEQRFDSEAELVDHVREASSEEARKTLKWIWAERQWGKKARGDKYRVESSVTDEVERVENEGDWLIEFYEAGDLILGWQKKDVRHPVLEEDEVRSRLQKEAKPVFIRQSGNDRVEIRGAKSRVRRFVSTFTESPDVQKVDLDPVNTSVVEGLSSLYEEEIETVRLVEAEFERSYLPDNSSVTISNEEGIQRDLTSDEIRPAVLDEQSLTDIRRLKFIHTKTDKTFTLKSHNDERGIFFDVQDNNIEEGDKEAISEILADQFGIHLNAVYEYDSQLQDEYILNQFLGGNVSAYDRYFDELPEDKRQFATEFTEIDEANVYQCYQCSSQYPEEPEECECGNDTFRENLERVISLDEDLILEAVEEQLKSIEGDISRDDFKILDLEIDREERTYNTYLKANFKFAQSAGVAMDYYYHSFYIYCLGNRSRLPRKIGGYLLDTVLVTYGKSYFSDREGFGTIDLYELLTTDSPEELLADAIAESRRRMIHRVRERVADAENSLQNLNRITADLQRYETPENELEGYNYEDLEKDVFYVFKFMFRYTERLGRQAEEEPDGCLLIPLSDGRHYVAGYDAKLSFHENGYDIDASEKKKAGYYVSVLNQNSLLRNLKDGGPIDGHIFVSNNFNQDQFPYVGEAVAEWIETNEDATNHSPVVFLETEALVQLYEVMGQNFDHIVEEQEVNTAFRESIVSELTTEENYTVFDKDSVERVREGVLEAKSNTSKSRDAF